MLELLKYKLHVYFQVLIYFLRPLPCTHLSYHRTEGQEK